MENYRLSNNAILGCAVTFGSAFYGKVLPTGRYE